MANQKFITLDIATGKKILKTLEASLVKFSDSRLSGVTDVDAAIKAELDRAIATEGKLSTDLQTEITRAKDAEKAIKTLIGDLGEDASVKAAIDRIQGLITALESTVNSHVNDSVKHITGEERTKWNKVISDLAQEVTNRTQADEALQGKIDKKVEQTAFNEFKSATEGSLTSLGDRMDTAEADIKNLKDAVSGKNTNNKVFATMDEFSDYVQEEGYSPKVGDLVFIIDIKKAYIYKGEDVQVTFELPAPPTGWVIFDQISTEVDLVDYLKKADAEATYRKISVKIAEADLDTVLAGKINGKAEQTDLAALSNKVTNIEKENGVIDTKVAAEAKLRLDADNKLDERLDVIEGSGEGSVAKALADAKAYTNTEIGKVSSAATALTGRVGTLEKTVGNASAGLVKDVADLKAADTTLDGKIAAEKGRAEAAELALSNRIKSLESNEIEYDATGLEIGNFIVFSNDGSVVKATSAQENVIGVVTEVADGKVKIKVSGMATGFTGLVPGKSYFLAADGTLNASIPSEVGHFVNKVGIAKTATELFVKIEESIEIMA